MKIDYKNTGKKIAVCRRNQNISQKALAKSAGITNNYLSSIENGYTVPSLETFTKVCVALGKTPDYFLLGNIRDDIDEDIADALKLCSPEKRRLALNIIELLKD